MLDIMPYTRVALLVDGHNHYRQMQEVGSWHTINHGEILNRLKENSQVIAARWYHGICMADKARFNKIRRAVDTAAYQGFTPVTKIVYERKDGSVKGNLDQKILLDAIDLTPHMDHLVLFSGDGDFVDLIERLQLFGIGTTVVCVEDDSHGELKKMASHFVDARNVMVTGVIPNAA